MKNPVWKYPFIYGRDQRSWQENLISVGFVLTILFFVIFLIRDYLATHNESSIINLVALLIVSVIIWFAAKDKNGKL